MLVILLSTNRMCLRVLNIVFANYNKMLLNFTFCGLIIIYVLVVLFLCEFMCEFMFLAGKFELSAGWLVGLLVVFANCLLLVPLLLGSDKVEYIEVRKWKRQASRRDYSLSFIAFPIFRNVKVEDGANKNFKIDNIPAADATMATFPFVDGLPSRLNTSEYPLWVYVLHRDEGCEILMTRKL